MTGASKTITIQIIPKASVQKSSSILKILPFLIAFRGAARTAWAWARRQPLHTTPASHTSFVRAAAIYSGISAAGAATPGPVLEQLPVAQMDIGHPLGSLGVGGKVVEGDRLLLQNKCTVAGLAYNHFASFSNTMLNERPTWVPTGGGKGRLGSLIPQLFGCAGAGLSAHTSHRRRTTSGE